MAHFLFFLRFKKIYSYKYLQTLFKSHYHTTNLCSMTTCPLSNCTLPNCPFAHPRPECDEYNCMDQDCQAVHSVGYSSGSVSSYGYSSDNSSEYKHWPTLPNPGYISYVSSISSVDTLETCCVCMEKFNEVCRCYIGHTGQLCLDCFTQVKYGDNPKCPLCRASWSVTDDETASTVSNVY